MALSFTNTTCDIYRNGNIPPATPDVAGVKVALIPRSTNIKPTAAGIGQYSHLMMVPIGTDIRDVGSVGGPDTVWIPNKTGTPFVVVWVARKGQGTALDCLEALLMRQNPTYPTNNL